MNRTVHAVATMDTKGEELAFVAQCLKAAGVAVTMVDVGTGGPPTVEPDVSRAQVLEVAGRSIPQSADRGAAVTAMGDALGAFLQAEVASGRVAGVLGLGGSGGTALVTAAMRRLVIGLPKLMVSTVASGDTSSYVDCTDILMMPSVVDVAGLNRVSRPILANAAHAMAGMVSHTIDAVEERPTVGMTMFGVTTPCVTAVRQRLEDEGFDVLVFHATGTGGRAMERLVESRLIQGVLDITTTEVADQVVGGVFPAGPERFEILLRKQVPLVMSLGALDMVNFGARVTVPERFRDRNLHVHNAQVTLMRTNVEENRLVAHWIANKLNRSVAPLTILVPEGGVSLLDTPGQPFHDPEADATLFDTLEAKVVQDETRRIVRLPSNINAPDFSAAIVDQFLTLWRNKVPIEN